MTPVIPCSLNNISLIPGTDFTVRRNNYLTRCSFSRKSTKHTLSSQKIVLPPSTTLKLFPSYKRVCEIHLKYGIHILSATGTDVVVEEPDSPVVDEESGPHSAVETSEKSSTKSDTSPGPVQSKRTKSVRKSEMPPVKNEELIPGATFTGKVRSIQPFGAFVDFGAFTDGLVHVSRLSDSFVKDVGDIVSVGQEVKVKLVEANTETGRIALTMRESDDATKLQQLEDASANRDKPRPARRNTSNPNPRKGEVKSSKFVKGQDLEGTVKNITRAGAFVSLPEGEEGFLPTSEESDDDGIVNMMGGSSLQVGQEVSVRVLRISRGQVTLTMKKEEDTEKLDSQTIQGVVHVATNPFVLAFRKNMDIASFLDEREKMEKAADKQVILKTSEATVPDIPEVLVQQGSSAEEVHCAPSAVGGIVKDDEASSKETVVGDNIAKNDKYLEDIVSSSSQNVDGAAKSVEKETEETNETLSADGIVPTKIEVIEWLYDMETAPEWLNDIGSQKPRSYFEADYTPKTNYEPAYLDIGEGITYRIPPTYDKLAASLNLPSFSDIQVEEFYLKGTLDLGSLAGMMASDKKIGPSSRAGMGEPRPQYESLQARVKALSASNLSQKFSLKVSEMNSSIPEGAAGKIPRSILSEGGVLQVYYVRVRERGDTYEIIERSLPKKQEVKKEPAVIEKEEMEKIGKHWLSIVKKDIPKHQRIFATFHRKQLIDAKRFSENCQREVKFKVSRSLKLMRGAAIRTRKLARDMLLFWKRVDKEMAEVRKKEEREAAEALRREQELREAKRQQQRLNFLIQQTELYSHFMQNKSNSQPSEALPVENEKQKDEEVLLNSSDLGPFEEEDPEEAELKKEALKAAQDAVSKQKLLTSAFDSECLKLRQAIEEAPSLDPSVAGSSNIDLQQPSTMPVTSTVQTPELFKGSLKEYQLKGLQWLVNCYEQGLNGILADEMGLGKTIQAMAFLAHLAEEKNIWGPFLVVAPASVLNNWADEISRFCPDLKTLPYWGGLQERTVLRKNINPKRLYRRDAGFHILITSYQLLVSDEKYFRRVKWQYMVLDEAQAIKSSNSIRWKTLLSFNCRNRLLLTGTPIQNNMAELWALLHFIMPTLFDSHEQFNEWFSKGIENHAEHGGTLNEHQLNRLHAILKPFMLRRVKKDVVSELTRKTEVTVHCKLSSRQQAFYQAIKNKISLAELFDSSRGHLNEKKILNLMNIVIQLRKVCNHPELFERNEGSTYLHFGEIPNSLLPPPFGELEDIHYSGAQNPITYKIPKLVYQEVLQSSRTLCSAVQRGVCRESFQKHFNIFSPGNVYRSVLELENSSSGVSMKSGTFGFTYLIDLSPAEVAFVATSSMVEALLFSMLRWDRQFLDGILDSLVEDIDDEMNHVYLERGKVRAVTRMLLMPSKSQSDLLRRKFATGPGHAPFEALVVCHQDRILSNTKLLHSTYTFIPRTRAPPVNAHCSDRNFAYKITEELHQPWIKRLMIGFARTSEYNGPRKPNGPHTLIQEIDAKLPITQPVLQLTYKIFGSCPPMQPFDPSKLLTDSGKLQTLDILLKRLRAENHRVLLFAQMTKMLNILEDYMNYRKYRYLRLDGSSTIMDRRDMVRDFQHRNDIFVFLLSTRAGGLGINLTAADTVIFYESDWNPTLDLQAMDRAHRLGQTKDVTVYRLICKETVEEKILQRASQKNTVQQLVMTGGHVQGDLLAPEDVVSLLLDDAQLEQKLKEIPLQIKDRQKKKQPSKGIRLDAEGDASLEDLNNTGTQGTEHEPSSDLEKAKSSDKKRKAASDKQTKPRNSQKENDSNPTVMDYDLDDPQNDDPQSQRPKRPKRPKKSVNENLEPAYTATPAAVPEQTQFAEFGSSGLSSSRAE